METTTFGIETPHDKDLNVLAVTKAKCMYALSNKICTATNCMQCDTGKKLLNCYTELSQCDQLSVDNKAEQILTCIPLDERAARLRITIKDKVLRAVSIILFLIAAGIAIAAAVPAISIALACVDTTTDIRPATECPNEIRNAYLLDYKSRLYDTSYNKYNMDIYNVFAEINSLHKEGWDINHDGEANCIDGAIIWKLFWDKQHPDRRGDCLLARVPRHLFIAVRQLDGTLLYIEPQAKMYYNFYAIVDSPYTCSINTTETERWLMEIVTGLIQSSTYTKMWQVYKENETGK